MSAGYERPDRLWTGPAHPDVITRGAAHAQALKHYTDMAEMAALRAAKAELLAALTALAIESGGKAIPNSSLTIAREQALVVIAKHRGQP